MVGTAESQGEDIASTVDSSDHEDSEIEEVTDVLVVRMKRKLQNDAIPRETVVPLIDTRLLCHFLLGSCK